MITYFKDTPIHYTISGNGPHLVLLHGFLLGPSHWDPILPELAKKNKVLIIDLPGHGSSGTIAKEHSMELMADTVHHILIENSIDKANFIGHSMGGYITLAYAEKYPNYIQDIVLLNSTSRADSPERKINRERAIDIINNNTEIFVKMAIRVLFPEERKETMAIQIDTLIREASTYSAIGIKAAIKGMKNRKDRTSILKSFPGNKYLIHGVEDPLITLKETKKAANDSNTRLFEVKSGHMSLLENKDEIVKIMYFIDFL